MAEPFTSPLTAGSGFRQMVVSTGVSATSPPAHLTCYSESDYDRNGVRWFAVGSEPPAQPTPPPSASPPSQPGQVSVRLSKPFGIPSLPRAGQRFEVAATVVRTDAKPVRSGAVACRARAGTTSVAAKGRIASESARCEMTLPRTARGKRLQGTMTVSVANAEAVTKRLRVPSAISLPLDVRSG